LSPNEARGREGKGGYTSANLGEVAQSVEHTAENRGVAGSIPALATLACGPRGAAATMVGMFAA
jgi:hypothetical protein